MGPGLRRERTSALRSLVHLSDAALSSRDFSGLVRRIRAVGRERLRRTYQTTFWYDLGEPSCVPEEAILALKQRLPRRDRIAGVEWWLSRMFATNVQVDFHRDRDEKLALETGQEENPRYSSVLFLNRVRGGALAVTVDPPDPDAPAQSPAHLDFTLVAPRPNRFVWFEGWLTHGVLDEENQIPRDRRRAPSRLRRALVMNWWLARPTGLPSFSDAGVYRALVRRAGARRRG